MKVLKLGFTGTKDGMDEVQKADILALFVGFAQKYDEIEFHHGDCIGADAQAAKAMDGVRQKLIDHFGPEPPCRIRIICHPGYPVRDPKDTRWRAFTECNDEIRDPKPFIPRDHDIVDETDELVATPKTEEERLQSGTWLTVRYARKKNKPITVLSPKKSFYDPHALHKPQRTNAIAGEASPYGHDPRQRGLREN